VRDSSSEPVDDTRRVKSDRLCRFVLMLLLRRSMHSGDADANWEERGSARLVGRERIRLFGAVGVLYPEATNSSAFCEAWGSVSLSASSSCLFSWYLFSTAFFKSIPRIRASNLAIELIPCAVSLSPPGMQFIINALSRIVSLGSLDTVLGEDAIGDPGETCERGSTPSASGVRGVSNRGEGKSETLLNMDFLSEALLERSLRVECNEPDGLRRADGA